jgi:hypothetical protein
MPRAHSTKSTLASAGRKRSKSLKSSRRIVSSLRMSVLQRTAAGRRRSTDPPVFQRLADDCVTDDARRAENQRPSITIRGDRLGFDVGPRLARPDGARSVRRLLAARPDVVPLDHLVQRRRLDVEQLRGALLHAAGGLERDSISPRWNDASASR